MDSQKSPIIRVFILLVVLSLSVFTAGQTNRWTKEDIKADSVINDYIRNASFGNALQTINQYRKMASSHESADAAWLLKSSEVYFRQGNIKDGYVMLTKAKELISRLNDPGHLLRFRLNFQEGRYFYLRNKSTEALRCFHLAEIHANHLKQTMPLEVSWLYEELGNVFYKMKEHKISAGYYQSAIVHHPCRSIIDLHEITLLKTKQANALWHSNEEKKAEMLFRTCVAYLDTTVNPLHPGLTEAYYILNDYLFDFYKEFQITSDFLRNATGILDKFYPSDHYLAGILFTEKSKNEYIVTDYENALHYSERALQILSQYQFLDQYKVSNYYIISDVYYYFERNYEKTVAFCNQYIDSLQGTAYSPAHLYYMIAMSNRRLNNESKAIENLNKVIQLTSSIKYFPDDDLCAQAYHVLSKISFLKKEYALFRHYLQQSLKYARRISDKGYKISGIYLDYGMYYMNNGDYQQALAFLQKSLIAGCNAFSDTSVLTNPAMEDIVLTLNLISCLTNKAYAIYSIYKKEGHMELLVKAFESQELAVKLIEKRLIDIDEEKSGLSIANLRILTLNNAVSYAVLLYLKTSKRLYLAKAWEYAEKSKMQVLSINTMKINNLAYAGLPDSLLKKEEALNREILGFENQIALDENKENVKVSRQSLLERLTRLYGQHDELKAYFEENYPAYKQLKYNYVVAGIDKIQQQLEEDQVILEYQLLNTELTTFIVTKNECHIHYQLIDTLVAKNINRLRKAIAVNPLHSDPLVNYREFTESSYYLYTKLIEPVYARIKNKRLIIIPHTLLTQIPFEVLISKKSEDNNQANYKSLSFLIREFPVTYAFSANLLVDRNSGRKNGSGTAIFLPDYSSDGRTDVNADLPILEGAAYEASRVRKLTGGRLFKSFKADETTFKANAHRYRLLHIASHTVLNERNPHLSCMVMSAPADSSGDGNLYVFEIMQMKLDAQLVVLSGCNTGYGLLQLSEGLISLARSFFYTGVRTVAFTLWPVADRASTDLVSLFYKGLRHRLSLDNALRAAKLSFLEQADPVKAHPFYWAGYVIVGRTESVPLPMYHNRLFVLSLLILLIPVTYLIIRKFRT